MTTAVAEVEVAIETKVCGRLSNGKVSRMPHCGRELSVSEFHRNSSRGGLQPCCRTCDQLRKVAQRTLRKNDDPIIIFARQIELRWNPGRSTSSRAAPSWNIDRVIDHLDAQSRILGVDFHDIEFRVRRLADRNYPCYSASVSVEGVAIGEVGDTCSSLAGGKVGSPARAAAAVVRAMSVLREVDLGTTLVAFHRGVGPNGVTIERYDEQVTARVGNVLAGKDPFAEPGWQLEVSNLDTGPSSIYAVRLPNECMKVGRGSKRRAAEHGGTVLHLIPCPTRWHATVAEALAHDALLSLSAHAPMHNDDMNHHGGTEVFDVDLGVLFGVMNCAAASVNGIPNDVAVTLTPAYSKFTSKTAARLRRSRNDRMKMLG